MHGKCVFDPSRRRTTCRSSLLRFGLGFLFRLAFPTALYHLYSFLVVVSGLLKSITTRSDFVSTARSFVTLVPTIRCFVTSFRLFDPSCYLSTLPYYSSYDSFSSIDRPLRRCTLSLVAFRTLDCASTAPRFLSSITLHMATIRLQTLRSID